MKVVPKKSLGQNFLLNQEIIKKIIDVGQISEDCNLIEIGPGTGNLTKEIIKKKYSRFITIEKDKQLYLQLQKKYSSNIEFFNEDVLDIDWNSFINQKIIVFGNLPYNISAKLLISWIKLSNLNKIFKRFILMFQKEVADRILAKSNSSKYGRLSILTEWKLNAHKIMDIEPENFYPVPKVKSTLIYLEPKKNIFKLNNSKYLEQVTNIFFQNKRKMIKKPLNILFENPAKVISKFKLDINNRPQNLEPLTYFKLSKEYEDQSR
tara:strand:- start:2029 stop:2820 length:792 start_codon:yes stop_codon:yes gene_type:complete